MTVADSQEPPNFVKVYSFLSNLFDPSVPQQSHLQAFQQLSSVNQATVQLLMHNLTLNIANEQFREQHEQLLSKFQVALEGIQLPKNMKPSNQESLSTKDTERYNKV